MNLETRTFFALLEIERLRRTNASARFAIASAATKFGLDAGELAISWCERLVQLDQRRAAMRWPPQGDDDDDDA